MGVITTRIVKFIRKGMKGDRGAILRGPQAWNDCPEGYVFQSGGDSDEYKDVVLYKGEYYTCVKSHVKTAYNYPHSPVDTGSNLWQLGHRVEMIASKILLSSYALVENLGVACIDMKDEKGNILFQAKDGNVTCKTGTFENIKVSGDITADSLNLKIDSGRFEEIDGSICIDQSDLTLPELPVGVVRSIKILNSFGSRMPAGKLLLHPATDKVRITTSLQHRDILSADLILPESGYNSGKYFELIGRHIAPDDMNYADGGCTVWVVVDLTTPELQKYE